MKYSDERKQKIYDWFHESFTVPEACDPAESPASGYQYACGGPYFAKEIINTAFVGVYPDVIVKEVIRDVESESSEWARRKVAV